MLLSAWVSRVNFGWKTIEDYQRYQATGGLVGLLLRWLSNHPGRLSLVVLLL